MKKEINAILLSLIDSIDEEEKQETKWQVNQLLQTKINWKNPEEVWVLHTYDLTKHMKHLLNQVYPEVNAKDIEKINFVYTKYDFVEASLTKMVDMGFGFSADVCRWLIARYMEFLTSQKKPQIPKPDTNEHSYYHPEFGTWDEWNDFIEALPHLYYGRPEAYFKAYATLSEKKMLRQNETTKEK